MRNKTKAWVPTVTLLGVMAMSLVNACHAQALKGRAGLWIESVSGSINGHALPGEEATVAPMGPEVRARVRAALKRYGLPLGGAPSLRCLTEADFDVAAVLRKAAQECPDAKVEKTSNGLRYQGNCRRNGNVASVSGEVRLTGGGAEMVSTSQMSMDYQGHRQQSETRTIQKWIGADCSNPPEGVDREWLELN